MTVPNWKQKFEKIAMTVSWGRLNPLIKEIRSTRQLMTDQMNAKDRSRYLGTMMSMIRILGDMAVVLKARRVLPALQRVTDIIFAEMGMDDDALLEEPMLQDEKTGSEHIAFNKFNPIDVWSLFINSLRNEKMGFSTEAQVLADELSKKYSKQVMDIWTKRDK